MKTVLIAAILVAAPVFAAEKSAAGAEDAIKAMFARVDACVDKKDSQCLGELFADDVTFVSPAVVDAMNAPKIFKGKAEVIKAFGPVMKDTPDRKAMKNSVRNVRLVGADHAFVDCAVEHSGGYYSAALLMLKGGKWLIQDVRSIAVYASSPPATPAQPPPQPGQPNGTPQSNPVPNAPPQPNAPAQPNAPPPNAPAPPVAPPKT